MSWRQWTELAGWELCELIEECMLLAPDDRHTALWLRCQGAIHASMAPYSHAAVARLIDVAARGPTPPVAAAARTCNIRLECLREDLERVRD